jgi:hypothetical protein
MAESFMSFPYFHNLLISVTHTSPAEARHDPITSTLSPTLRKRKHAQEKD